MLPPEVRTSLGQRFSEDPEIAGLVLGLAGRQYIWNSGSDNFILDSFKAISRASPGRLTRFLYAVAAARGQRSGTPTCECCALTEWHLSNLAAYFRQGIFQESVELLAQLLREATTPKEAEGPTSFGHFGATIVRCSCQATIQNLVSELGGSASPFEIHKLTTSLTSPQRTRVIQAYMSFGGDRAAMCVLRRGREQLYDQGNPLGRPHILALVSRFVTRHHVLLADGSIDVGIEALHRCTDSVVLQQLPASYAQLLQLGGRVSRLALDLGRPQPPIAVRCPMRMGTVEELLARHMRCESERERKLTARGQSCPEGATSPRRRLYGKRKVAHLA